MPVNLSVSLALAHGIYNSYTFIPTFYQWELGPALRVHLRASGKWSNECCWDSIEAHVFNFKQTQI